jgi:Rod binding domain-containing protein
MSAISGTAASALAASSLLPPASTAAALSKGEKAARDFEAQLIGSLLASFEKSFASVPGEQKMAGEDNYNYMGTQALASVVAAGGGFGIAKMISEHMGARK